MERKKNKQKHYMLSSVMARCWFEPRVFIYILYTYNNKSNQFHIQTCYEKGLPGFLFKGYFYNIQQKKKKILLCVTRWSTKGLFFSLNLSFLVKQSVTMKVNTLWHFIKKNAFFLSVHTIKRKVKFIYLLIIIYETI